MSADKLDLSQVSVSDIFNDNGPTPEPVVEETTEAVEEQPQDEPQQEEQPVEEPQAEDVQAEEEDVDEPISSDNSEQQSEEEESIISELQAKLGYELDEDFDESIEGLTQFTKATAEKMAQEQMQNVFNAFPDVQEYLNYRANGGDPRQYFQTAAPERDFSAMEVTSEDVTTQKQIVGAYLESQGFDQSEITETLEDYEDAGILERHAKKALTRLQTKQAQDKQVLLQQQQAQAQQQAQENERMWNEINGLVQEGTLKGLTIPERDKKRFFNWMAAPIDKQGNSQRAIDRSKLDQETLLALEYIVYKGFDLSKLVANTNTTQKARSLRSKLSKGTSSTSRMKSSKPGYTKAQKLPDLKDLL
jgi:transcriptional regulator